MSGEFFLFIEVVETTNKNGGPQDLTTPKVGNRCGNIWNQSWHDKTRRFNSQSPGAMDEDEPPAVRVLLLPAVEEPPSPTHFHSSQRFSLGQCSKIVFFHFDRQQKNQFLEDGQDSGPPSLPWTLPSLVRPLLDRPPLTPRLDRPPLDPSSAGPPSPGPPKISLSFPLPRPQFRSFVLSGWLALHGRQKAALFVHALCGHLQLPVISVLTIPQGHFYAPLRVHSPAMEGSRQLRASSVASHPLPAQVAVQKVPWSSFSCLQRCSNSQPANALFLTCSNATLTSVLLGTSVDLVSLFACALLCRSRSRTTLARRFLETAAVCGPSTSMVSRACHKWITSPPPAAVHGNPGSVISLHGMEFPISMNERLPTYHLILHVASHRFSPTVFHPS